MYKIAQMITFVKINKWKDVNQYSLLEFFDEIFVNLQAEILDSSMVIREYHRRSVIRKLAFGFGVAAKKHRISVNSYSLNQLHYISRFLVLPHLNPSPS